MGREAGLKRIDYPSKERRAQSSPWRPPTLQKGSPEPLGLSREGQQDAQSWACGPDPLPLSLVSSAAGRALRSPATRLFLPLLSARTTSVAQLQESRQTADSEPAGAHLFLISSPLLWLQPVPLSWTHCGAGLEPHGRGGAAVGLLSTI